MATDSERPGKAGGRISVQLALSVGSVIFAVGVTYGTYVAMARTVDELRDEIRHHRDAKNHADNTSRVDVLTVRVANLEDDRSEIKEDVAEIARSQQKMERQVDRLCDATPRCKTE